MPDLRESARAFLDALEAAREAALALSREKAEEAKLLEARLDGFREAVKMFSGHIPESNLGVSDDPPAPAAKANKEPAGKRRTRRNIPELIARELSFSGQPMTARQIARAIEYHLQGTETALRRMEKDGQVLPEEGGLWAVVSAPLTHVNGRAFRAAN